MATVRNFTKRQDGASAVEFAIVLPVLLLVVFGIMDFGRAFYIKNNLVAALREGARVAAAMDWDKTGGAAIAQDSAQTRVQRYISGTIGGTAIAKSDVSVVKDGDGYIHVKFANNGYLYQPITPYANKFNLANIYLRDSAVFRYERQF